MKIFTWYGIAMCLIQCTSFIYNYLAIHNLYLSHFYFVLQFIILSFFYLKLLKDDQRKVVKVGLVLTLFALAIQYLCDDSMVWQFNLFEIFITSFMLSMYAIFHFYNLLNEDKRLYYINAGILIYLFGSSVVFLSGNVVAKLTTELNRFTWLLNAILYIIYQLLILFELRQTYLKPSTDAYENN